MTLFGSLTTRAMVRKPPPECNTALLLAKSTANLIQSTLFIELDAFPPRCAFIADKPPLLAWETARPASLFFLRSNSSWLNERPVSSTTFAAMWSWYGGASPRKKDTRKDAIDRLRASLGFLRERERHLQSQVDFEQGLAREHARTNENCIHPDGEHRVQMGGGRR